MGLPMSDGEEVTPEQAGGAGGIAEGVTPGPYGPAKVKRMTRGRDPT
jgi:hypothetical protein